MEDNMEQIVSEQEVDPMENLMQMLGELQERYNISQEEMDSVVDGINMVIDPEYGVDEEVPVEEQVEDEVV